jgi:hypothetical protein
LSLSVLPLLLILASTPRIDGYVSACAVEVDGFTVPRNASLASAPGTVRVVKGTHVEISHCFYENAEVRAVRSVIDGLTTVEVKEGDVVRRGQRLGRGTKVTATIDGLPPGDFVEGREHLVVPPREPVLVVVDVEGHRAVRFAAGHPTHEWEVGRGQAEGAKEERGDLRTPHGLYFVVDRTTGPFAGDYSAYFGGAWAKVNYPNAFDAERGVDAGLINRAEADDISAKWRLRAAPPQRTKLGGGIGFHGWNAPWDGADGGFGLSWGCVVLHPEEARAFYDLVPVGAAVVLL